MKNLKYIFISSIILFIIMSLIHFVYDILNFDIIAIFFPTNESIFQHMKMIFTAFFLYYLILFVLRRRLGFDNIFLTNLISVSITIIFFLVIYLPIRFRFGENMIFTFILLFISIFIGQLLSYSYLKKDYNKGINLISIIVIAIIFIIFAYFTFNPMQNEYFWDPEHETYNRIKK